MIDLTKYTPQQKANISALLQRAQARGITNPLSQAALLSIVSKETGFNYKAELSYRNTANAVYDKTGKLIGGIRKIFTTRVAHLTDAQLTALKANDKEFFDTVYGYKSDVGRKNGNTQPGDGYKYRGRGPNQITFKNLYAKIGKQIGVDLVNNPDLANDPKIAADIAIQYFLNAFTSAKNIKAEKTKGVFVPVLSLYNSTGINDFKALADSVGAFYHANAGWGKSKAAIDLDPTKGFAKAKSSSSTFYEFVSKNKTEVAAGGGAFFFTTNNNSDPGSTE